jgi:hypothetical protein
LHCVLERYVSVGVDDNNLVGLRSERGRKFLTERLERGLLCVDVQAALLSQRNCYGLPVGRFAGFRFRDLNLDARLYNE